MIIPEIKFSFSARRRNDAELWKDEENAVYLPRQDFPGIIKSLKSSYIPSSLSIFCVSTSILPTIYQYFWRVRLANATAVKKAQKELNDIERNKAP